MPAANQADFFGEGVTAGALAPEKSLAQIAAEEEAKRKRAEQARLASIPYGTPINQGGTANQWAVTTTPPPDNAGRGGGFLGMQSGNENFFAGMGTPSTAVLIDPNTGLPAGPTSVTDQLGTNTGGGDAANHGVNVDGAFYKPPSDLESAGTLAGNGYGGYGTGSPDPNAVRGGGFDADAGNALANQVVGTQPTVDPNNAVNVSNRDKLTPVIDPNLASTDDTDKALAMSQELVDRVMDTPLQTKQLADQALSNQLLIARSARGGAGATQNAMDTAINAAPGTLREGAQASINEQVARAGAAGQAASIFAGVAGNTADRAERIAGANQNAGLQVLNNLTTLTGFDYQFDTAKMGAIGQLARDYFNNAQVYAGLDLSRQKAVWEDMTKRYGIDAGLSAAVQKIAADEGIGELDTWKMILGGIQGAGTIAAGA
jgi:hypothetical protein